MLRRHSWFIPARTSSSVRPASGSWKTYSGWPAAKPSSEARWSKPSRSSRARSRIPASSVTSGVTSRSEPHRVVGDGRLDRVGVPAADRDRGPDPQGEGALALDVVAQGAEHVERLGGVPVGDRTLGEVGERAADAGEAPVEDEAGADHLVAGEPAERLGPPVGLQPAPGGGLQEAARAGLDEREMLRGVDGTDLDRARHGGRQYRRLGKAIRSAEPALAESTVVIVASGIELRAGPRLLLDGATFRIAPGDRVGLVGRNGAGKTTLTKVLAGEGQAAAGTVTRSGDVGYLPQDPRTGDLSMLARDRILSARGLDTIVHDLRATEKLMASEDDAVREKAMGRYERLDAAFNAQGGYAAESEAARIASALGLARPDPRPAAAYPLRRSAPPGGADPHPLLRSADAAPRRAHEPPRRRLDRLAARLPARLPGRPRGHQPRRRDARHRRQPGVPPRRQPGRDGPLQRRLEGLPHAARDRRAAAQAGAAERREEGRRPDGPGRQDAGQGHQGRRRPEHGPPGRAPAGRPRGRARRPTGWPRSGSRTRRRPAGRRCARPGCRGPTGRWRCSPTWTSPSTAARGSWCWGSTVPARRRCCGSSPAWTPRTPARSSRATG